MDKGIIEGKERIEREKQDWIEYERSKIQKELELDRQAMNNQLIAQRDKEINKIIQKLSQEHIQFQKSSEKSAEEKIRQTRESCNRRVEATEKENAELKSQINSLSQIKGSLNENMQIIMRRLSDSAVEIDDLKSIKAKQEAELNIFRTELQQANANHERNLQEAIEREREKQIPLRNEIHSLQSEIEIIKQHYESRLEEVTHKEAEAFEALEQRVRSTISKKDSKIKDLTDQLNSAIVKINKLEEILDMQRRELTKI
jgi:chromosome segregation ATPase